MENLEDCLVTRLVNDKAALPELIQEGLGPSWVTERSERQVAWVMNYYNKYGHPPTQDELAADYPAFTFEEVDWSTAFIKDQLLEAKKKRLIKTCIQLAADQVEKDPDQAEEIINMGASMLAEVETTSKEIEVVNSIPSRKEAYEARRNFGGIEGIPSGFEILDRYTRGWQPEDVITIVARMGTGKTWFLLMLLNIAWQQGYSPLLISKEMSTRALSARWDALSAGISYFGYRSGELTNIEEARLYEMWKKYEENKENNPPFYITGEEDIEGSGISSVMALVDKYKPDIVGIDGMYLLRDERGAASGWEMLKNITQGLKRLAKVSYLPIIGTTQASRSTPASGPVLETISYSDSVGQDSDIILAMHQTEEMKEDKMMKIRVIKSRESDTPSFQIQWDLDNMRFRVIEGMGGALPAEDVKEDIDYEGRLL